MSRFRQWLARLIAPPMPRLYHWVVTADGRVAEVTHHDLETGCWHGVIAGTGQEVRQGVTAPWKPLTYVCLGDDFEPPAHHCGACGACLHVAGRMWPFEAYGVPFAWVCDDCYTHKPMVWVADQLRLISTHRGAYR